MFISGKFIFYVRVMDNSLELLPIVTILVVLALHRILYHNKVLNLAIFRLLKLLYIYLIESSIFVISISEWNKRYHKTHKLYYMLDHV